MLKSQTTLIETDGWKATPVQSDTEIAFDVYQCGICEYLKKYDAIVLAEIFCELDMIGVEYMPGLVLERVQLHKEMIFVIFVIKRRVELISKTG